MADITFNCANEPNPGRLIESLRHIGYSNYEAIADIVDNCFDAEADNVVIRITQARGDYHIIIADDGTGMDNDTLDQALRLGSLTERDPTTDLGKFGMGLVTAGLSLSRRTHVITKQAGSYLTSIVDIDEMVTANKFCKHLGPSDDHDKVFFDEILPSVEHGTIVCLTKTDGLTNKNVTQFASILRKELGEIHRYFITAGKTIVVNGEKTPPRDPLELDNPATQPFSDDVYPIEIGEDGHKVTESIRVRIVLVPQDDAQGDLALARNMLHQGFYGLRNNRQIFRADTLGLFVKHNSLNRMRAEIFFTGKLDNCLGIEFTKRDIEMTQSVRDQLGGHLQPQVITIKNQEKRRDAEKFSEDQAHLHEQASKVITEKSRLLLTPKARIEKRSPKTTEGGHQEPTSPTGRERRHFKETQSVSTSLRCKFLPQALGPTGQIYEADTQGRTVIIRWNTEHPFYRRFIMDNIQDGRLVTAVDFLVYSMACAELRSRDEDNYQFVNNMKAVISGNLRTLLS